MQTYNQVTRNCSVKLCFVCLYVGVDISITGDFIKLVQGSLKFSKYTHHFSHKGVCGMHIRSKAFKEEWTMVMKK